MWNKDEVQGKTDQLKGKIKESVGNATNDEQLRDEGKYRRGREQLLVCARDVCPAPIKRDCLEWLSQLEAIAPTIVLGAKEGTKDLSDVKVSVDGVPVTDKLDGKPIQMDLGKHTFKFEFAGQTKEEDFIIGAGQKNRNVSVTFPVATSCTSTYASYPPVTRRAPSGLNAMAVPIPPTANSADDVPAR